MRKLLTSTDEYIVDCEELVTIIREEYEKSQYKVLKFKSDKKEKKRTFKNAVGEKEVEILPYWLIQVQVEKNRKDEAIQEIID